MPPLIDIARWFIVAAFSSVLIWAAASDIKDRRIPNWTVAAIATLFMAWLFVAKAVSIVSSLEAALIMFAISCALYLFRIVGAGDSKLATAVALFVGLTQLAQFALIMSLVGGAIAVVSVASRPTRALVMFQLRGKGDFGRGVPYGVAIALAGIFVVVRSAL